MFWNLRAEMARKAVFFGDLAKALNIRNATVSDKINGKSRFYIDEAITIRDEFFPDHSIEYLFSDSEDETTKHGEVNQNGSQEYARPINC
ncbi:hypothetical protein [Paenibacillus sp. FSL L8-0708]|uniref:hypothetical protein n=1 Tax=Paenibacillus sp. FSL L8-0708 TaxID=2975311 RepID=UPI0030FA7C13